MSLADVPIDVRNKVHIRIDGVQKTYKTRTEELVEALTPVSLDIRQGEFISLVGPSGCGKTTLLKIIAGLVSATSGEVVIGGRVVAGPSAEAGMVFQAPTLLPWRTILENVMVPVEVQRLEVKRFRDRAMELLELVGLSGFEHRYPNELSGGMQQRAGICRALVYDPDVLLMDEPFGALDAMTREFLNEELLRIWSDSGKTIVFVTHSIPEAVFLSERVVVMSPRPGRVEEVVEIGLPHPRRLAMMTTDDAGTFNNQIRRYFNSEGVIN